MKRISGKGLIIIGYQGIGKSSIASQLNGTVDLESSSFKIDGKRDDNWFTIYCCIAVSLARQGYTVMISSHECVVNELAKYNTEGKYSVIIICPNYILKGPWIEKLYNRYHDDPSEKNKIAWTNAELHFDSQINNLATNSSFSHIFIEDMNYDLNAIIRGLKTISHDQSIFVPLNRMEGY